MDLVHRATEVWIFRKCYLTDYKQALYHLRTSCSNTVLNVWAKFKTDTDVKRPLPSNPCFREKLRPKVLRCWDLLGESHLQQPALSPPLTSTCYNHTQQPANRDSGSSQQTRTQLRVADVRVDLTTLRIGQRFVYLSLGCFINLLNKAGSRTPWLPVQFSK